MYYKHFIPALALCFFAVQQVHSQDFSKNYTPLESQGKLPEDFIVSASSKANKEIEKLQKKGDAASRQKMKFVVSSTFFLDNVLKSGKVLYGDPISIYVNKVANQILDNDPSLKGKIRVYVVKSPVVNAYTFDNGVVLVNTGLISQLENESQLAYVLCHEFIHFKKKHQINAYIDFIKMDKKKKSYNRNGTDLLLEKSKYSQKNEFEADGEGFDLYSKTKYNYKTIDGLFDVLQYSYLPFDEIEWDKSFFNDRNYIIPGSYYLDKVKEIAFDENYNDTLSTHPNIAKRRAEIEKKISNKSNDGRKDFIVSESEFKKVRDIARFETCRLYMLDLDYCDAIYSAYILLKQYPDNIYLKKIVARSLYEVAAYKSLYDKYSYTLDYENYHLTYYKKKLKSEVEEQIDYADSIQGNSQQVFHLLKKMSPLETTVLALNNNWKLNQALNYEDPYTLEVCDSLFNILTMKDKMKLEDFSSDPPKIKDTASVAKDTTPVKSAKEMSKYDKIKKNKKTNGDGKLGKDDYSRFAFVDFMHDQKFTDEFKSHQAESKKSKKNAANNTTASNTKRPVQKTPVKTTTTANNKTKTGTNTKNKKKTDDSDDKDEDNSSGDDNASTEPDSVKIDEAEVNTLVKDNSAASYELMKFKTLGIDKIVIVDPFYMKLDMRKKDNVSYFSGEAKQKEFSKLLEGNANRLRLEYEILDPNSFDESDMEKYNDLSFINDWVAERLTHGDFDSPIVLNNEFKQELLKKFGTNYFMWTGAISTHEKKENLGLYILGCFIPYTLPFCIGYVVTPKYDTYFYSIVFDIQSGKIVLFNEHTIDMNDKESVLNSVIYDTFYQVKMPASLTADKKN